MSGHTPGRWFAEAPTSYWVRASGGKSLYVARTDMGRVSLYEQRANARLIAAAPEMLEALLDCRRALQFGGFMQELAVVDAAIAKATGANA